jgi:hypothetical protein
MSHAGIDGLTHESMIHNDKTIKCKYRKDVRTPYSSFRFATSHRLLCLHSRVHSLDTFCGYVQ